MENWIPTLPQRLVKRNVHLKDAPPLATVNQLMLEGNKGWNHGLLDCVFVHEDVAIIKGIRLPTFNHVDTYICPYNADSSYTESSEVIGWPLMFLMIQ